MGLHVYCIVPASLGPAPGGIEGRPVFAIRQGDIAAWCSEHERRPDPAVAAIREHDRVVRAAMSETITPLPLRFGQWVEDRTQLVDTIAGHADAWRSLLAEFAGRIEMGVRATTGLAAEQAAALPGDASSGRDYMQRLAARVHARDAARAARGQVIAAVGKAVGALATKERWGEVPEVTMGVWLAHLVRHQDVDAYRDAIAEMQVPLADWRVIATGPWPPYSFAA